jgi:exodeoxyribonuclease X
MGFLPHLADLPTICSMRFAQLVLPEAPNYKNQGLRQYLSVTDPRLENASAHRALADVIVTMLIFRECIRRYRAMGGGDALHTLLAALDKPRTLRSFSFGRHRGQAIDTVPTDYLKWLASSATSISEDALFTARAELERRAVCVS